ncbi:MAG: hypothetical protein Kow0089_07920 [Desulfobulbaceae bacterium]
MSKPVRKIFIQHLNLLAFLSAVLLGLLLIQAQRMILLSDLENKGNTLARILASVALDAAMTYDYATMERYVADIVSDPAITGVEIRRADNERLASAGTPGDARSRDLVVRKPITLGNTIFGEISISLSTKRVDTISRNLLLAILGAVIFFHFFGIVMSSLALKKAVIIPLGLLNTAMERFRQGNLEEKVSITEPEEFADIGHSFNQMARTISHNFDEIHKQREQIQLEQNKLATIVSSMADGLFVTDNDGVILSFNRSAISITGFSEEEAVGSRCIDLFQTSLCSDACAVKNEGKIIHNLETTLKTKDGRVLDVAVSSAMLYDADGTPLGGVQTFRDITADKKRQELYCHTEKLAAIGQLAAGVAHEINNPLSNILGYARNIRVEADPEEIERKVAVIVEQTRKCSEIVKGLLNFSRSSGADPRLFQLTPLIERTVEMLRYQADRKKTAIHFTPGEPCFVYADPAKIEQVVFNLLLNAIQAVPENSNIRITTGTAGAGAYFTVEDDGPGIPPELLPRIFDPFFTTKPVGEGTGLGLSICAGIIAEADGSIDVESGEGGGTVFTVLLPMEKAEEYLST